VHYVRHPNALNALIGREKVFNDRPKVAMLTEGSHRYRALNVIGPATVNAQRP